MFALPAADLHVRRAISSPRFAEPSGSSCTFRSLQLCATPAGHETKSKLCSFHRFLDQQDRLPTSISAESSSALASPILLTSLHKSLSPIANRHLQKWTFHRFFSRRLFKQASKISQTSLLSKPLRHAAAPASPYFSIRASLLSREVRSSSQTL
jgi:hypothetical protein